MPDKDDTTLTTVDNRSFPHIPANALSLAKRKPLFGVGINDADYVTNPTIDGKKTICPFYLTWYNMITRCYSAKYHVARPTYIGCTVAPEWLYFMTFRAWMVEQDWQGKQLDKDLLYPGNKVYSPGACVFISGALNRLLNDSAAIRGDYPQGVTSENGRFHARLRIDGNRENLGFFDTAEEAYYAYRMKKSERIRKIAVGYLNPIRNALHRWANIYDPRRKTSFDWVLA